MLSCICLGPRHASLYALQVKDVSAGLRALFVFRLA